MFDKLSDKLNQLMISARVNASELARLTGIPASTIKKIRNCDNPNPTLTTLLPIARQFGVTLSQLIGEDDEGVKVVISESNAQEISSVPVIEWQESVSWPNIIIKLREMVIVDVRCNRSVYALNILDSDLAGFAQHALIIVDPVVVPKHRDYVVVNRQGSVSPMLRQLVVDDGQIYFRSLTADICLTIPSMNHQILGTVIEYRNKFIKE